jgi:hypothetical protein
MLERGQMGGQDRLERLIRGSPGAR